MTTTKQLRRWLISVARPVLKPLGASIVFRHVDQLAGLALLAISAGAVTKVAGNALGAPASETAWLPNTAAAEATIDSGGLSAIRCRHSLRHRQRTPLKPILPPPAKVRRLRQWRQARLKTRQRPVASASSRTCWAARCCWA